MNNEQNLCQAMLSARNIVQGERGDFKHTFYNSHNILSLIVGGRRTFNFLRGPMFYGQGRMNDGNRDFKKIRTNLGGS